MSSSVATAPESPSHLEELNQQQQQQPLTRNPTAPSSFNASPKPVHEMQRQSSASGSMASAPVHAVTAYLKHLFGYSAKPTKRSLSEEAECGSPESLSEWLRQGSNPNEFDAYGYSPLINACLRGCVKSVKILLINGADINMKAMHGYAPLHAAAQNGFSELVETLIDQGADMEIKNDDGDTPLMLAVRSDHPAVVDVLCKRGCDMHTQGFDNIEPIDYAINKRNLYLSDVLMKHERQHNYTGNVDSNHNQQVQHSQLQAHHHSFGLHGHDSNNNNLTPIKECPSLSTLVYQQQELHQKEDEEKTKINAAPNDSVFQSD